MDVRRRSARLWCLVAACSKLLLMAAAATTDPALLTTRRARAACNWAMKTFVLYLLKTTLTLPAIPSYLLTKHPDNPTAHAARDCTGWYTPHDPPS